MREDHIGPAIAIMFVVLIMCIATAVQGQTLNDLACLQWGLTQSGQRVCMRGDLVNRDPVTPLTTLCTGMGCTATVASPELKCEEGWERVYTLGMQPMCAREFRKPQ